MLLLKSLFAVIFGIKWLCIKGNLLIKFLSVFGSIVLIGLRIFCKMMLKLELLFFVRMLILLHKVLLIAQLIRWCLIIHLLHLVVECLLFGQNVALRRSLIIHLTVHRVEILLVIAIRTAHLGIVLLLNLHWLDLSTIHVDSIEIGTASPRQNRITTHLERLNCIFGLVNGVHHVLVDRSIDEDMRPLVLMFHRVPIVRVLGILIVGIEITVNLLLWRRTVLRIWVTRIVWARVAWIFCSKVVNSNRGLTVKSSGTPRMYTRRLLLHLLLLWLSSILVVAALAHVIVKLICLRRVQKVIGSTRRLGSCIQNMGLVAYIWTTSCSLRRSYYVVPRSRLLRAVMELLLHKLILLILLVFSCKIDRHLVTLHRHGK